VPHSFSPDGCIRFGDTIILRHDVSGSVLACDPYESMDVGQESYLVTTVNEQPMPRARNVFRVVRPPRRLMDVTDREDDPLLRVGQPFMLACHEALLVQPDSPLLAPTLYLSSVKKNERTATKRTNRQLVFVSSTLSADAIWMATIPSRGKVNGAERFLSIGQPVMANNPGYGLQLTHRQTNMYLTCDPSNGTNTEFGAEFECFADRSAAYGKIALMVSEFKGTSTSLTLTKPDSPFFSWHFLTASSAQPVEEEKSPYGNNGSRQQMMSRQSSNTPLPPAATPETVLATIRAALKEKGVDAFWNLRETFKGIERRLVVPGKLDRTDLAAALLSFGVGVGPRYLDMALDLADSDGLGLIELREAMALLRGPLTSRRMTVIDDAFSRLDVSDSGAVAVAELQRRFFGGDHPLCAIGGYSEAAALEHLLRCFEIGGRLPQKINRAMFMDYYGDLSAAIDDDDYFEAVIRSNWSL